MADLRDRIRAVIEDWDRTTRKGTRPGEFVYLLSERERSELAERIAEALEANP